MEIIIGYLNIMNELKIKLWDGWLFDGELIHDPFGNKWNQNSLNSALMGEQLYQEIAGTPNQIDSLKTQLQKRIAASILPEIYVRYGDGSKKIIKYQSG